MSVISSFRSIEYKHDVRRGKDCMKKFSESLREQAMKIINFKKKKMKLSTKEQQESYEKAKICYICREKFEKKYVRNKKYCEVRDHCHYTEEYRGAAHSTCNLKYSVPKKFLYFFIMDLTMIIKELSEQFEKHFTCLGENAEKYITFIVPVEKEVTKLIKMEKKLQKIYLTDYNLFIPQDLWQAHYQILSITFLKEFIKFNLNMDTMIKHVKLAELNINIAAVFLNSQILKMI